MLLAPPMLLERLGDCRDGGGAIAPPSWDGNEKLTDLTTLPGGEEDVAREEASEPEEGRPSGAVATVEMPSNEPLALESSCRAGSTVVAGPADVMGWTRAPGSRVREELVATWLKLAVRRMERGLGLMELDLGLAPEWGSSSDASLQPRVIPL